MAHTGWDVSNWQGDLPGGLTGDFIYVLASDGGSFKNPDAPQQVAAARKQGKLVGFYHFYRCDAVLADQLLNFQTMCHALGGSDLPLATDFETPPANGNWQQAVNGLVTFCRNVESWTNDIPNPHSLIYVNINFYDHLAPLGFPWGRWVWLADPSDSSPTRPCLIWQQAPRANPWNGGMTDPDIFVGSDTDWAAFTGKPSAPVAPQPPVQPATVPGVALLDATITLPAPLDQDGNGWYDTASLNIAGLHDVNQIQDIVWVDEDPTTVHRYDKLPSSWGKTETNQLVVNEGSPGCRHGCTIYFTP